MDTGRAAAQRPASPLPHGGQPGPGRGDPGALPDHLLRRVLPALCPGGVGGGGGPGLYHVPQRPGGGRDPVAGKAAGPLVHLRGLRHRQPHVGGALVPLERHGVPGERVLL